MSSRKVIRCRAISGQASIEYLIVCSTLVAALLIPIDENDKNVIELCIEGIKNLYVAFAYAKSLPALP